MTRYLASIALVLTATSPALASASEQPPSVTVSHADLDLANNAGRATLERRVASAIKRVCGEHPAPTLLYEHRRVRKCRTESSEQARREIDLSVAAALSQTRLSSR